MKAKFQPKSVDPGHSHIEDSVKTMQKAGIQGVDPDMVEVQCFPLYSILLAVGTTHVDFFSLDVEGHEIAVLKTVPFHKVFIKVSNLLIETGYSLKERSSFSDDSH